MKKLLFLMMLSTSIIPCVSQAEVRPYLSVKGGASYMQLNDNEVNDTLATLGIAGGLKFNDYLRSELEYTYRGVGEVTYYYETLKWNTHSLMLQNYVDIPTNTPVKPFLNVGLGGTYAYLEESFGPFSYSTNDTTFTWNAGVGINFKLTDNMSLDTMYRYVDYGKPFDVPVVSHDVLMGLRVQF